MKMKLALMLCCVFTVTCSFAQSKVFKEVNDEISSTMKVISQDDALMGYLVFTQLERANEDSFNYKISIMDENLNDIGTVNFREENLDLQAVSFEQDVLCLAYVKTNMIGNKYAGMKSFRKAAEKAHKSIFTQFINLQGKIIQTNSYNADIKIVNDYQINGKVTASGKLKHDIILKNIPQKGFACFYGDGEKNALIAFNTAGKQVWKKDVQDADGFALLANVESIYILSKRKDQMLEAGFEVRGYKVNDATAYDKLNLRDKKGNPLKVLSFENDPGTGRPIITGNIIDQRYGNYCITAKQLTRGTYDGVFTMVLNGPKKSDVKATYSYWEDGSNAPAISKRALYADNQSYSRFSETLRDYNGNTYFVGSAYVKKAKWGAIASAIVLSPFIFVSPILLAATGTQKCRIEDAMVLKQDSLGKLSFYNSIPCDRSHFFPGRAPLSMFDTKKFYTVTNATTKSNFLIVDDIKNVVIYNVNAKKVIRTVPHKAGGSKIYIFPAKEGHIMVAEYNKNDKYTRLSIEAL